MHAWILPEFVADLLPVEAAHLEHLRRTMIDRFGRYGYQLIQPPLFEYIESLRLEGHTDLEMQTFKLVDQLSGRELGLRADMTPQAARIDAHLLNRAGVTRLCYAGPVAYTRPRDLLSTREPYQIGAELYGHGGLEAELEIVDMLLDTLAQTGLKNIHLDLGHAAIQEALFQAANLDKISAAAIGQALNNKDSGQLAELTADLDADIARSIRALADLYGDASVLSDAAARLAPLPAVLQALQDLRGVVEHVQKHCVVRIDLAEQRVGAYHSGVVFAAYADGWPSALARGGRYDEVGRQFGRPRPAVGFSLDARELLRLLPAPPLKSAIAAPNRADSALLEQIDGLRRSGETVIVNMANMPECLEAECDRQLVLRDGQWQIESL